MKPARENDIPKATYTGEVELLGIKTRVYRLDDGSTVIDADDFHMILQAMGMTLADFAELLKTTGIREV